MNDQHQQLHAARERAERVAMVFGDSAPRPMDGEPVADYQRRLLRPYLKFSPTWNGRDLSRLPGSILEIVERQVYSDAIAASTNPAVIGRGQLVERFETDRTGRRISRFYGDPEACWGPFKQPTRNVVGMTRTKVTA